MASVHQKHPLPNVIVSVVIDETYFAWVNLLDLGASLCEQESNEKKKTVEPRSNILIIEHFFC
jgi:hypothetical protein